MSDAHFEGFLDVLRVVESRIRRVRAVFKDTDGRRRAEFTIRSHSVEPGVMVDGEVFRDARLERDAEWLADTVSELSAAEINSAQASRKLIRSTREQDDAELELRALTARALAEIARIGMEEELTVEFENSGPKRGPVYFFSSVELLASIGDDFAVPTTSGLDAVDALSQFAEAVWCFRSSRGLPGAELAPVNGTQGESSIDETLEMAELAGGLLDIAGRLQYDEDPGSPVCVHHFADQSALAWIAHAGEIAVARLEGARAVAALGRTRALGPNASGYA
jgi:hypothetical protein